ncbi:hypothetical protein Ae406Ps2_5985 [Pseudonocardia sp. Ae406_Ps2]|nr:hypothetical protein Ae406Ps2_5985 [Pseudonocardia sp. Ae406_Ps2]
MYRFLREATELLAALAPNPGPGDRGRAREGVRDPRRDPAELPPVSRSAGYLSASRWARR